MARGGPYRGGRGGRGGHKSNGHGGRDGWQRSPPPQDNAHKHCTLCGVRGHMAADCKVACCPACGQLNPKHSSEGCPSMKACLRCGGRWHEADDCEAEVDDEYPRCSCGEKGAHHPAQCPSLWRIYVPSAEAQDRKGKKKVDVTEGINLACGNCAMDQHFLGDCVTPRPRASYQTGTSVFAFALLQPSESTAPPLVQAVLYSRQELDKIQLGYYDRPTSRRKDGGDGDEPSRKTKRAMKRLAEKTEAVVRSMLPGGGGGSSKEGGSSSKAGAAAASSKGGPQAQSGEAKGFMDRISALRASASASGSAPSSQASGGSSRAGSSGSDRGPEQLEDRELFVISTEKGAGPKQGAGSNGSGSAGGKGGNANSGTSGSTKNKEKKARWKKRDFDEREREEGELSSSHSHHSGHGGDSRPPRKKLYTPPSAGGREGLLSNRLGRKVDNDDGRDGRGPPPANGFSIKGRGGGGNGGGQGHGPMGSGGWRGRGGPSNRGGNYRGGYY